MGKLQLAILAFIIISCLIHITRQYHDRDYLKHLLLGKPGKKDRILYLDYIRLLATLFVILVHCIDFSAAGLLTGTGTWIAVQSLSSILFVCNTLFIMNSGALILNQPAGNPGTFYYKRFLKVAIPFFCYYWIYILLSCRYFNFGFFHGIFLALKDIAAGPIDWTPHFWVIYVILSLYILAPFWGMLLRHLSDTMLHGLAVLILLFRCAAVYLPVLGITLNFDLMITPWEEVFLLGYYFSHPTSMTRRKSYWILGSAACLFSVLCVTYRTDYKAILLAEGAPAMILLAGSAFLIMRALENRLPKPGFLFHFIIRYSYSILLVHWAVLYYVREWFENTGLALGLAANAVLSFLLVLILSAAAAFLFDQTVVLCAQSLFNSLFCHLKRN